MVWVLVVTWLTAGQPPSSYQNEYATREFCELAKEAVLRQQAKLQEAEDRRYLAATKDLNGPPPESRPVTQVQLACASKAKAAK